MALADRANEFVDRKEPWELAKQPTSRQSCATSAPSCSTCTARSSIYLAPVLPRLVEQTERAPGRPPQLGRRRTAAGRHAGQRVHPPDAARRPEEARGHDRRKQPTPRADAAARSRCPRGRRRATTAPRSRPSRWRPSARIDDFTKVDLRVARVIDAEHVPEAKKLLKLTVSLGGEVTRTVFAGIKSSYEPRSSGRAPGRHRRQPRAAQNEVRRQRGHGRRRRRRRKEVYLLAPEAAPSPASACTEPRCTCVRSTGFATGVTARSRNRIRSNTDGHRLCKGSKRLGSWIRA